MGMARRFVCFRLAAGLWERVKLFAHSRWDRARSPYFVFRLYGDFLFCWRRKKEAKTALFARARDPGPKSP
jgi:hypothetical protein